MQLSREWPELLHPPRSVSDDWSVVLPFCETLRARAKPYDRKPSEATFEAAEGLVDECLHFLSEMSCYSSVDAIVAMPPSNPSKSFDLPSYLASAIGDRWGRENLSGSIATMASRPPLK